MALSAENLKDSSLIPRLKWIWNSAPLLSDSTSGESRVRALLSPPGHWERAAERFRELYPTRKTERLGETFELLYRSILESHPQVARVVPNLLLPQGEIDLLWSHQNRPEEFMAIELAVKFYLHDPAIQRPELRWIGPGRKDHLHRKIRRIIDVQLPRAQAPQAMESLKKVCPEAISITDSVAWVRGSLFASADHHREAREDLRLCPEASPDVPLFPLLLEQPKIPPAANWLLDRWQWICEVNEIDASGWRALPLDPSRAQMALLDTCRAEQRRAFVAPPGWSRGQP